MQLLSPSYHSRWLPYGVIAQWSHKCLRPNPAIPKEQGDAPTDISGRLNGLSRRTIRKLTTPRVTQLSIFRKCLLQVRHPNSTRVTGHHAALGRTHNPVFILGQRSLLQEKDELPASAPQDSVWKNAYMPLPLGPWMHICCLLTCLSGWRQSAVHNVIFSTLSTDDDNLQCVMSFLASSQLMSTLSGFKK